MEFKSPLWKETDSNVVRVLRPGEAYELIQAINMADAPRYLRNMYTVKDMRTYISCLLLTGMRYPELQFLQNNEGSYFRKEGHIYLPQAATGKDKRKSPSRYVRLSDVGRKEIEGLWVARNPLPEMYSLDQMLHKWAHKAGFPKWKFTKTKKITVKGPDGRPVMEEYTRSGTTGVRIKKDKVPFELITDGVCIRSFRKTWESWLLRSFPGKEGEITDSQGHDDETSKTHYRNLIFDDEDIKAMRPFVVGYL